MRGTRGLWILWLALAWVPDAAANEFDDYRVPPHRRLDWNLTLQTDAFRSVFGYPSLDQDIDQFRGAGTTVLEWLSDSDPRRTRLRFLALGFGSGSWQSALSQIPGLFRQTSDNEVRDAQEILFLSFQHWRYPWRTPWGFSLATTASGIYEQRWTEQHGQTLQNFAGTRLRDENHATTEDWLYLSDVTTSLMAGWGRVRDATAMYEAHVLERRLRQSGALTRDLSPEARARLVALLAVRFEYETHRERPAKVLWRKIESILADDGALREGGLDAASILRAGEHHNQRGLTPDLIPQSPFLRPVGGFVGPVLLDRHNHYLVRHDEGGLAESFVDDSLTARFSGESHFSFDRPLDEVFLGIEADLDRPLSMRWQVDLSSQVTVPVRRHRDGFQTVNHAGLSWMVADRWAASASVSHLRSFIQGSDDELLDDRWLVDYGIDLSYYLEDHVEIGLFLGEDQRHEAPGDRYSRDGRAQLMIGYRILGGFSAPGLIPAETLRAAP